MLEASIRSPGSHYQTLPLMRSHDLWPMNGLYLGAEIGAAEYSSRFLG